jgi:sulfite reductase (NADPH) hemoprotein beta-component
VPWQQILVYIEAIVRVYNLYGRRDNLYKARIKILVKAEGQKFIDAVHAEFQAILADDAGSHEQLIPQAELDRVSACFVDPPGVQPRAALDIASRAPSPAYRRWLERNVHAHRLQRLPRRDAERSSAPACRPAT